MKIAITGARGRLGSSVRWHFENNSYQVLAFSRNADAMHEALGCLPKMLRSERVDAILHMAWSTVPLTAERNPGAEWEDDLPRLASLLRNLDALKEIGVTPPRLVFFSSCSVYGEPLSDCPILHENDALRPKGWYARGKVQAEQLIEVFAGRGIPVVVLRVTNPYGFSQDTRCMQGVIPALVRAAVHGKEFPIWGGDSVKDYLHISDLCRAVERVVQGGLQGTYNVAAGHSVSLSDLVRMVENITRQQVKCRVSPPAPWDVRNGRYSHQALTKATGWKPEVDLEKGLPALVRLFKDMSTP